MKIALVGCRGIPARYGGFETLAEQLAVRLAAKGHQVLVYCRGSYAPRDIKVPAGVTRVSLPALYTKHLETISHTFLCALHQLFWPADAVLLMNNANAIFIPLLKFRQKKIFVHVDGLEWQRDKWGRLARAWHQWSESWAVRWADGLISDSHVIAEYYAKTHGRRPAYAAYGADFAASADVALLEPFGLTPGEYLLFVGRMEPENHPDLVISAHNRLGSLAAAQPLVIVGWAPYAKAYEQRLRAMANPRVLFLGGVYGNAYRALLQHCRVFLHASSVGGTHPVLVEAMGEGKPILSSDIPENRETLGDGAEFFELNSEALTAKLQGILEDPSASVSLSQKAKQRALKYYRWDEVADAYEKIFCG